MAAAGRAGHAGSSVDGDAVAAINHSRAAPRPWRWSKPTANDRARPSRSRAACGRTPRSPAPAFRPKGRAGQGPRRARRRPRRRSGRCLFIWLKQQPCVSLRSPRRDGADALIDRHPRLGQTARQQAALAELRGAIACPHLGRFGGQVEGPRGGRRAKQVERLAMKRVEALYLGRLIELPALAFHLLQQPAPIVESQHRHPGIAGDGVNAHVGGEQILIDGERAKAGAEKAGRLPVQHRAIAAAHQRTDLHPARCRLPSPPGRGASRGGRSRLTTAPNGGKSLSDGAKSPRASACGGCPCPVSAFIVACTWLALPWLNDRITASLRSSRAGARQQLG